MDWDGLQARIRRSDQRHEGRLTGAAASSGHGTRCYPIGLVETVSVLVGTSYGDLMALAKNHAPEGLLVYVEASGDGALDIARDLWRMRLTGWFARGNARLWRRRD